MTWPKQREQMKYYLVCPELNTSHTDHRLTPFVARLLRSLGAVGAVGEVGKVGEEAYIPTKVTRTFVIPPLAAGVEFWSVTTSSIAASVPEPHIYPILRIENAHCSELLTA